VYALIDSERTQAGEALATDRQGFVEACSPMRIPCRVLERRAIENYLPEHAIRVVKSDKYRVLGHYETLPPTESTGLCSADAANIAR